MTHLVKEVAHKFRDSRHMGRVSTYELVPGLQLHPSEQFLINLFIPQNVTVEASLQQD